MCLGQDRILDFGLRTTIWLVIIAILHPSAKVDTTQTGRGNYQLLIINY
jgi:hypothetical protein